MYQIKLIILAGAVALLSACEEDATPETSPPAVNSPQPSASQPAATPVPAPSNKGEAIYGILFQNQEATLAPGGTIKLGVFAKSDKSDSLDLTGKDGIQWSSSEPDIVDVDAQGTLKSGANAVTGNKATVTATYHGFAATLQVTIKYALDDTITVSGNQAIVTNLNDVAVVVNKKRGLPESYAPKDLVEPDVPFSFSEKNEKRKLRKDAAKALEELFALAKKDGIRLYGVSGYRSYATQKAVYNWNVKTQGQAAADKVSAKPGLSEHQTGLSIDVSSASAGFALEESFGATAEGEWLAAHAHEAGFIIRYPQGMEAITGYTYEPWHIRYVGKEIALDVSENGWTLEEYFQDAIPVNK